MADQQDENSIEEPNLPDHPAYFHIPGLTFYGFGKYILICLNIDGLDTIFHIEDKELYRLILEVLLPEAAINPTFDPAM